MDNQESIRTLKGIGDKTGKLFEKLGVFKYSKEDGTPASRIKEQVHYKTKEARYNKIMALEQQISKIKLEEKRSFSPKFFSVPFL